MVSDSLPAKALFDPIDGVGPIVEGRRWVLPLVALALFVSLSGAAAALKLDPTSTVVSALSESGDLARTSENEVQEKIQQAGRIRLVGGVAAGIVRPLAVLFLALVLMFWAWLFGLKAPFGKCFTAAAVSMLPIALYHLLFALAAFRQVGLSEADLRTLVPSSLLSFRPDAAPKLARLFGAVDFFSRWAATLRGLGFAQTTGVRKTRGVALGLALYVMYAAAFLIGLPGLAGGQS